MPSSLTGPRSGSVANILTENQIPYEAKDVKRDETGISIVIVLLVNSIPLATSACKAPAQVSVHLCPVASSMIQHSPIAGEPEW